jgi:Acetyltransferase (GNAT) domain
VGTHIWRGMNKGTKLTVKKGMKSALEVRNLTDSNDLRKAHEAWMATARRKGFSDVRPWKGLEPVLCYSVNNRLGLVLGSFLNGKLLAAIFVAYVGGTATYVYGGYMDNCEQYHPNHVLQYKAIQQCLEMGVMEYSFGDLSPQYQVSRSGVDQFKLGFGAIPRPQTETVSWIRKPLLCSARDWVKRQKSGKRIVAFLKDRAIRNVGP